MRQGGYPDPVVQFHIDQGVREPAQRAVADSGIVFGGVGLGILAQALQRRLELPTELPTETGPLSLVVVQRLPQFGLGVRVKSDWLQG